MYTCAHARVCVYVSVPVSWDLYTCKSNALVLSPIPRSPSPILYNCYLRIFLLLGLAFLEKEKEFLDSDF